VFSGDSIAHSTAAATSATAAAASATAAAASYDSFDDRYLGTKSSDPSTDNDGATLLDGALYFNTSTNVMMVYDLGGTTWNRTTPTSADQTKINTVSGIASDVTAVAAKATEIGRLGTADAVADMAILGTSDVVTDMNTLGTADVVTDMNVLGTADVVSDMNTLATSAIVTDMDLLATSANVTAMGLLGTSANVTAIGLLGTSAVITDLGILGTADVVTDMNVLGTADVVADMNTLAVADVITDMNVLATADIVTDMNLLATSANVTAMGLLGNSATVTDMGILGTSAIVSDLSDVADNIAGVNSFAARYRVASSAPASSLDQGDLYFNTTTNELQSYGTSWQAVAISAANQVNINIVAGDIVYSEDLGSIADAITTSTGSDISTVADAIAHTNSLAASAVIADMALLATTACIADMAILGTADVVVDLNTLGTADVVSDMNTLGTADVVSDMNTLGTSGNVTNMNTVAGSIADVNRYANEYTIASSAPGSPSEGDLWYDSTANVLKYYTGSVFAALSPGIADVVSDTSPQLGGALDCQNNNITNTGTVSGANLQIDFGGL